MHASGDQSGEVRHVHQVDGSDFVGDLAHAGEVDGAGIGRASADEELGLLAHGDGFHLVIVEGLGFAGDAVADDAVGLPLKLSLCPWVRCPPWARSSPMMVSPGWMTAA